MAIVVHAQNAHGERTGIGKQAQPIAVFGAHQLGSHHSRSRVSGRKGVVRRLVGTQFADGVLHPVDGRAHHGIGGGTEQQSVAEIMAVGHSGKFCCQHKTAEGNILQVVVDPHRRVAAPPIEEALYLAFPLEEKTAVGHSHHADERKTDGNGDLPKRSEMRKVRMGEHAERVAGCAVCLLHSRQ